MTGILEGVDLRTQLAGQNRLELLLFRLVTPQRFGINVFKVKEVIQCPPLTELPGSHSVIRGITRMRGRTIPVMDLSLAIGGPMTENPAECFVIITEYNRRVQGFLVGGVDRIVNLKWETVLPPPKGVARGSYMTAVTQVDKELVEIIDVEKVLDEVLGARDQVTDELVRHEVSTFEQHVMVVDDSVVARNQVKRVLEQIGVPCTLKSNGKEAYDQLVEWAKEHEPLSGWLALVISDIEMPKMDGYSLTTSIRANARFDDLKVILHSSLSGIFNEAMVQKVGADRFLAKFDADDLAVLVQDTLKAHQEAHTGRG